MDKRWTKDEAGQWWWKPPSGNRRKGREALCTHCGELFPVLPQTVGKADRGIYCSLICANRAKKHGRGRRGPEHHAWKGGRTEWPGGYIAVRVTGDDGERKYILEHRRVMEQHLGRSLEPHETVHHLNGVKDDNRIENLELWTGRHGKGVRHDEAPAHCPTCRCFEH